ncbi:MAG TPA: FtsX-like permease family protein, partial [Saprospiraceae bacterium]|nr:FtsX-like permease family protein [Saprospiraceae bacterium]
KGQFSNKLSGKNIRKSLVVFQFLISTLIITAALTVRQQVNYIFNKNIGIDKDNLIYVESGRDLMKKYPLAKEQLLKNSAIAEVSGAYNSPLNVGMATGDPTWEGFTEDQRTVFKILGSDYNFCEMMKIPLVDGRFLSKERGLDSLSILLNETALRAMNLKDPLGKQVKFWGESFTIVGIVKDFHISSLHADIAPLIIVPDDGELDYIFVRPAVGKTEEAIAALEATHKALVPAYPFEYKFLDKTYENMYQKEKTTSKLADWFGLIALLISALGLLGLATFAAEQRTKEIGIRKILGASVGSIVTLISKDFIQLVFIAFVIAIPISWYLMKQWLEEFAFAVKPQWWIFGLTIGIALLVTIVTVGIQALRAASNNPVDALRSE